jgi:hypothetical protein
MGWWKVENTESVIGDRALDLLSGTVLDVVDEYQREFGRRPTGAEWEALLLAVLGAEEPDARVTDEGVARKVRIDFSADFESPQEVG